MAEQLDLEDALRAMSRREHPATSREAAASVVPKLGQLHDKVLSALRDAGPSGLTDMQLDDKFAQLTPTMRPRRVELVRRGLVADSGRVVLNAHGRRATVWVLAEHAHSEAA
jgi:hypothetical protein